jgi:hypothetical protein
MPAVSISHHEACRSQKQAPRVPRLLWPGNPLHVSTCSSRELFLLSWIRASGACRGNPAAAARAGCRLDARLLELGRSQVRLGTGPVRRAAVPGSDMGGRKMGP